MEVSKLPKITITREDLLRSKVVTPGWYACRITNVEEAQAKTDGSRIINVDMVVMSDGPVNGVPIQRTFSEKAFGFATQFIEAIIGREVSEDGGEFELSGAVGRDLDVFIKNEKWQNRLVNRAEDFAPLGTHTGR
jgi:hypothetical protein